jgi:triacylglycerol esterase/lipase EstA (alpha/beta hydrolase family)
MVEMSGLTKHRFFFVVRSIFVTFLIFSLSLTPLFFPKNTIHAASAGDFLKEEGPPPPGANDPNCRPNAEHPEPVILVPGTLETMQQNWSTLAPLLAKKGYCVYALNYGLSSAGPSTGPIQDSAMELKTFVDNVLELTGAKKVSIVGHSQGGMMPRYYIKYLGGADKVDDLIGLSPSNHGTIGVIGLEPTMIIPHLLNCTACDQQQIGSDFLKNLNEGDETPGNVSYTVVTTRYDEIVVPYTSAFLDGPSQQVTNITLQDYAPLDTAGHIGIAYDPNAYQFVLDALAHDGPADPDRATR